MLRAAGDLLPRRGGLSRMHGDGHVRFLGGWGTATFPSYPTPLAGRYKVVTVQYVMVELAILHSYVVTGPSCVCSIVAITGSASILPTCFSVREKRTSTTH